MYLFHAKSTQIIINMPSLKPVVRKNQVKIDGKSNIKIRISHNDKVRYIATPWYIEPKYMGDGGIVKNSYPSHSKLNTSLQLLISQYNDIIYELGSEVMYMDCNSLVNLIRSHTKIGGDFIKYTRNKIKRYRKLDKFALAETYNVTIDHLLIFTGSDSIPFKAINVSFLESLELYFRYKGLSTNTISVYMRNIRAIFNDAIDEDLIKPGLYPFRKYKIPHEKTKKRALTVEQMRLLQTGPFIKAEQKALDLFFLSFYMIGMNFIDLLYSKKTDIENGRLVFRRAKTGRIYSIKIQPEAQEIINRYQGGEYLLKFVEYKQKIAKEGRSTQLYKDIIRETNKLLKRAAKSQNIDLPISTYYARHTWATLASEIGITRDIISHALGHNIDTTTDIYIDFDLGKVDQANRKVIDHI